MDDQLYEKLESRNEQMTILFEELQVLAERWQKIFDDDEIYQRKNEIAFKAKAKYRYIASMYLGLNSDDSQEGFHNVMHGALKEISKASQKKRLRGLFTFHFYIDKNYFQQPIVLIGLLTLPLYGYSQSCKASDYFILIYRKGE